jgi:hypothetical protein
MINIIICKTTYQGTKLHTRVKTTHQGIKLAILLITFSNYYLLVHHLVDRDDWHLLARGYCPPPPASEISVVWQILFITLS